MVSGTSYYSTKWLSRKLLAIKMRIIQVKMNKLVYLRFSILELSEIQMYKYWYEYISEKYNNIAKSFYTGMDGL